eukprot:scaffold22788_cov128-Isochrysis_galbana.AAC.6
MAGRVGQEERAVRAQGGYCAGNHDGRADGHECTPPCDQLDRGGVRRACTRLGAPQGELASRREEVETGARDLGAGRAPVKPGIARAADHMRAPAGFFDAAKADGARPCVRPLGIAPVRPHVGSGSCSQPLPVSFTRLAWVGAPVVKAKRGTAFANHRGSGRCARGV